MSALTPEELRAEREAFLRRQAARDGKKRAARERKAALGFNEIGPLGRKLWESDDMYLPPRTYDNGEPGGRRRR
jgi:hypothetical protein